MLPINFASELSLVAVTIKSTIYLIRLKFCFVPCHILVEDVNDYNR
jgi:hypothetical protein